MSELNELWATCRQVNVYAALVAMVLVCWRLVVILFDPTRTRDAEANHRAAWFVYIAASLLLSSLAAQHYASTDAAPTWTSGARLLVNLAAVALCLWWPPARRSRVARDA